MKTTLDLPEELVATLERAAAREQRNVSDMAREIIARGLAETPAAPPQKPPTAEERRKAMADWLKE